MSWSKATPFSRPMGTTPQIPVAWSLQELHVLRGEMFGTPAVEETLTEAEEAALVKAEQDRLTSEAYDAGYRAGQSDAQARAAETMSGAVKALHTAAAFVTENEAGYLTALEDHLSTLAVCVARQIIAREVRTAPGITMDLIRRAVAEFPLQEALRIRLNPFDLTASATARDGEAVKIAPGREVAWIPDARVEAGGCVVEGRERILDGRVDVALERAYRLLTNTVA
ncbi:MAG: FliH/SctL family protein [bacterium]